MMLERNWPLVLIIMVLVGCFGCRPKPPAPAPAATPVLPPISEPVAQADDSQAEAAKLQRRINESIARTVEHYNSAEEVAFRKSIETKLHFDHLRILNEIESGSSRETIEIMKLRHQEELNAMNAAHDLKEAEWKRKDDAKW